MSNNLILYSDKISKIKSKLQIEGVTLKDTKIRLCLEIKDNYNLYFNGSIDQSGNSLIEVPALKNLEGNIGLAHIEVVADSTFFEPYKTNFEIKQSKKVMVNEFLNVTEEEKSKSKIPEMNFKIEIENEDDFIPPKLIDEKIIEKEIPLSSTPRRRPSKKSLKDSEIETNFLTFSEFFEK